MTPRCPSGQAGWREVRIALWFAVVCAGLSVPPFPVAGRAVVANDVASPRASAADPAQPAEDDAAIRKQLDEILAQPMFRRVHLRPSETQPTPDFTLPKWLEDLIESIGNIFAWLAMLSVAWQVLAYSILGIIVAAIIWLFVKMLRRASQSSVLKRPRTFEEGGAEIDLCPGELPADVYVGRAEELAAQGRYQEAIGQLLLGAMSTTEREGLIRFRRGLTYRDYIRALRTREHTRSAFRTLVGIYEPLRFGHREARSEHYDTCLSEYRAGFAHA